MSKRSTDAKTLARECVVISLHTPLTPETHHIIRGVGCWLGDDAASQPRLGGNQLVSDGF